MQRVVQSGAVRGGLGRGEHPGPPAPERRAQRENVDNALQVENNQVVLDLSNLITQVKQRLVDRGLTVAENIPATTSASIVLFNVPNATSLQTGYSLLNAVGFWLPLIAIALAVLGIFISHRPRRALAWFGFGLLVAMTVAAGALAAGRLAYTNELPVTVDTAAATAIFDQFTYFLRQSLWAGAAGGAVLLFGGLLLGDGNVATGIRRVPVRAAAAIRRWLVSWACRCNQCTRGCRLRPRACGSRRRWPRWSS